MAKTLYGEYGYTGAPQTITLPPGLYLFELYGAQGNGSTLGGKGAVVYAVFDFSENLDINMYIGNGGRTAYDGSNFNGGGQGGRRGGAGGGATDIRIGGSTLYDRVIVAGGGGGGGGGLRGGDGGNLSGFNGSGTATGGTQTAGGTSGGSFGIGGSVTSVYWSYGAGGGGWYGGGGAGNYHTGGGGSSYIRGANGYVPMVAYMQASRNVGAGKIIIYDIKSVLDIFPIVIEADLSPNALVLDAGNYHFDLYGAQGGYGTFGNSSHGKGGRVSGQVALQDNVFIEIRVGGYPGQSSSKGYNGGGSGHSTAAGGGGGATDIRIGGNSLYDRVLVAGGGGGQSNYVGQGGAGGGLVGLNGASCTGGTQTEVGSPNGKFGIGGNNTGSYGYSAGGGGGWYGGGGGGTGDHYQSAAGGSSYFGGTPNYPVTNGFTETGVNSGNGYAIITLIPVSSAGAVNIQGSGKLFAMPLFAPADTLEHSLRIGTANGIKSFKLVDILDENASPIRIQTPSGVKALSLEEK